jgi:hypothetical protein
MTDHTEGLPEPSGHIYDGKQGARVDFWTEDALRAYGEACAKAARATALEEAQEACDNVEEPRWYGYENPYRFDDGARACVAAIRALSSKEAEHGSN